MNQPPSDEDKRRALADREALFQRRLAERQMSQNQFPWSNPASTEAPTFEIPKEQSKLFADRFIEDPNLSDEEIERRALLDLTSYNFWTFFKRLHYEFKRAQRYKRSLSVLMATIDNLQSITNQFGLQAENTVVLSTGRLLLACLRDVDIAGRCRDDTFGVILPETPSEGAAIAAERIRTRMEKTEIAFAYNKFTITMSVGCASYPGSAESVDILVGEAVKKLQSGIAAGGNTVVI